MIPYSLNPMGHDPIVEPEPPGPGPEPPGPEPPGPTPTPDPPTFLTIARSVDGATVVGGTITGGVEMASGTISFTYDPDEPYNVTAIDNMVLMDNDEAGEAWAEVIGGTVTTLTAGMGGIAINGCGVLGGKLYLRDYVSAQNIGTDQGGGLISVMGPYAKVTHFAVAYGGTMSVAADCVASGGVIEYLPCYFYGSATDVTIVMEGGTHHVANFVWNGEIDEDTFSPDGE